MKPKHSLLYVHLTTHKKVKKLMKRLGLITLADTVNTAADITESLVKIIKEGGKVTLEEKNGSKSRLILPGVK
jgi:hypothetical protein